MKRLIYSFLAILVMSLSLVSCSSNGDMPVVVLNVAGVWNCTDSSTGYTAELIVGTTGNYDHISIKAPEGDTIVDITTMMSLNGNTGLATISDQGLGGYSGTVQFKGSSTAQLHLSNAQGKTWDYTLDRVDYPTTIAGTWTNASTGATLKVALYPWGIADKGYFKANASAEELFVEVGAIDNYGKGVIYIGGKKGTFQLGTYAATITITTLDGDKYTLDYVFK